MTDDQARPLDDADLADAELEAIYDQVDAEIAAQGLPSEEEICRRIAALNYEL